CRKRCGALRIAACRFWGARASPTKRSWRGSSPTCARFASTMAPRKCIAGASRGAFFAAVIARQRRRRKRTANEASEHGSHARRYGDGGDCDGGAWHGEHAWVLRADARSKVAASLTRAQEFAVLRVAHASGVIAPKPLFLCRDSSVLARDFFILERLPGIAAGHRLTREPALVPDPDALVHALGANLARLHAVRPPRAELDALSPPPANPALAAVAGYRSCLDRLDDAYPALEFGLRWCERHAPATFDVALIHRDYRTGNYLVDAGRTSGVLDWEFAGWGDPREDLGWFTARCWRFGG